ncbi:unnamed protein product [Sphenostylis stenocarpa]|uniref:Peptidase C1A papain C-terminal domain-containing protein n=1 Tax=Sphenostylis stenocarpa TaxID=92480 RepID=A0AA86SS60_9FABA|nr:unnamed protein product [Sphenostylis stenocarpa]
MQAPKDVAQPINMASKKMKKEQHSCDHDEPESWDWSKNGVITEVKKWLGIFCHGTIGAIHAITTGNLVSLSEQELVDCVDASQGCYNGWHFQSFQWVKDNGGIATEDDYPYNAKEGTCKADEICELICHYIIYSLFLVPYFDN